MAEKSPDACVNELIDSLGQAGGRSSGVPLAAIVAPIVVVGEFECRAVLAERALGCRRPDMEQHMFKAF